MSTPPAAGHAPASHGSRITPKQLKIALVCLAIAVGAGFAIWLKQLGGLPSDDVQPAVAPSAGAVAVAGGASKDAVATAKPAPPREDEVCDGQLKHVELTAGTPVIINPGAICQLSTMVTAGRVVYGGLPGAPPIKIENGPDDPPAGRTPVKVLSVVSLTPQAGLDYLLCPMSSTVHGWSCQ